MNIKTTLIRARNIIRAGWTKERYGSYEGGFYCYCAVGALKQVVNNDASSLSFEERLRHVADASTVLLQALEPEPTKIELLEAPAVIITFNDWPDTTKDDVIALFDLAIETLEEPKQDALATASPALG